MSDVAPIVDKDRNEFSTSFMGMKVRGQGPVVVLMLFMAVSTGYVLWELEQQNVLLKNQMSQHAHDLNVHDHNVVNGHEREIMQHNELIGAVKSLLYITCLSNVECRKFDLHMPEPLREMQRR